MSSAEERAARNQATFRAANERLRDAVEGISLAGDLIPFICECSERTCTQVIRLRLNEYETVRANPTHFVITPGHESGVDEPVETSDRFTVVAKTTSCARTIVARADTRTCDTSS